MIAHDPTEGRHNTLMPAAVLRASQSLPGLEHATGADFLISSLRKPKLTTVTDAPVHQLQLKKHTLSGALVQRKDGRDFLSSIPDLASIQARMLDWTGPLGPVMLIIGKFERGRKGQVILDGKTTKTSWSAYSGAKMTWQARGGLLAELSNAQEITSWVNWLHGGFLAKLGENKTVVDRPPAQALVKLDDDARWWLPLIIFPNIGEKKAHALSKWLPEEHQTLAGALCYLADPDSVQLDHPEGFGRGTFAECRAALGLEKGERLRIQANWPKLAPGEGFVVTWPPGSKSPVDDGLPWIRQKDGSIQGVYTREAACLATEIMKGKQK